MAEPLITLLKQVREAHNLTQAQVEECMELAYGTYRHIEKGRRKLPDFQAGLAKWIGKFEDCVGVSQEEHEQLLRTLSHQILEELSELLNRRRGR